jgi:WD40 repeat protein
MVHMLSVEDPGKKDRYDVPRRTFTGTLSKFPYIGVSPAATQESKLSPYRKHTSADPLACLVGTDDGHGGQIVFAGGHDDVVLAYGINSACAVASVYSHRDAVTGLDIIERPAIGAESVLWSESSTHIMVSGSWDATVKVWSVRVESGEAVSINREPLAELFDADSSVGCISATPINGGIAICAGCADGSFVVWICHDDGSKCVPSVLQCFLKSIQYLTFARFSSVPPHSQSYDSQGASQKRIRTMLCCKVDARGWATISSDVFLDWQDCIVLSF